MMFKPTAFSPLKTVGTHSPKNMAVKTIVMLAGAGVLTVSAKFSVPFFPVPFTLQTLVVLMLGSLFGPRLGTAIVATYLAEGAAGLPVFAGPGGAGVQYFIGPTGGFLVGFLFATALVGRLTSVGLNRSLLGSVAMMLSGAIVIYIPGLAWLGSVTGWEKPVLEWGLYPFIYGDLLKLTIASLAAHLLAQRSFHFR